MMDSVSATMMYVQKRWIAQLLFFADEITAFSDGRRTCCTAKFYVLLTIQLHNICNEDQLDALFILNLFRHSTSACFGLCCPSSGGIQCIQVRIFGGIIPIV
jgi:hypothetical protein